MVELIPMFWMYINKLTFFDTDSVERSHNVNVANLSNQLSAGAAG